MSRQHFSMLILGGEIIDGTKRPRFRADVGIQGDRIAAIGDFSMCTAEQVIDARNLVVAPGFIDAHTHDDQAVIDTPDMVNKVSQGVTTVVVGNCGISAAPLRDDEDLPMPVGLLECPPKGRSGSFSNYFDKLERNPAAVNVAALVGHTTLRATVMPDLDRAATSDEVAVMQALLQEGLDAGALGMSTGTFYSAAQHAPTSEIVNVGKPLSDCEGLYVTHMRDEANHVLESLQETFQIGKALNVPVVISHHKVSGQRNFGRTLTTLPIIQEAMKHQCVSMDCYPYAAGSTMIRTDPAMLDGRVKIVSSDPHPEMAGRDLDDIAEQWGLAKAEAAKRLQPGSAVYFLLDEADVQRVLQFDQTMIGSDGIPSRNAPHPRLWGTFPRVLGHYSRDVGLCPLETAVWKMTGLTAQNFGIKDRGIVAEGKIADLTVFNPSTVRDHADYDHPTETSSGIQSVLVNGELTWHAGRHSGKRPGTVLRRQPSSARTQPLG